MSGHKKKWEYRNIKILAESFKSFSPVVSTELSFWCGPGGDREEEKKWCDCVERSRFFNHNQKLEPYSIIINTAQISYNAERIRKIKNKPYHQSFSITTKAKLKKKDENSIQYFNRLMELHKPILHEFIDKILDMEGVPEIVKNKSDKRMSYNQNKIT